MKIRIFILVVVIILSFTQGQLLSQNQSILLPFSGDTYSPTGSKMLNFANTLTPVVESLPKHPFSFWYEDIYYPEGNPHNEDHLANADPLMIEKYLGQHPMFAQQVVHDKDGNLLFFIVDNDIYNSRGESFSGYWGCQYASLDKWGNISRSSGQLGPEIVVFPIYDSSTCYKFGLVYSTCACSNMTYGATHVYYRTLTYYNDELITLTDPILISENFSETQGCGNFININLAISEYRQEYQNYLLFVHFYNRLEILTVGQTGNICTNIACIQDIPLSIGWQNLLSNTTSEMEVIKSGGYYYVAMGSCYEGSNGSYANVHVVSLNNDESHLVRDLGNNEEYNFTVTLPNAPNHTERIKGLEFSPNGDKLFVTYTGQTSLNYISVSEGGIGCCSTIGVSHPEDYQYTEIESGRDDYLYYLHSTYNGSSGGVSRLNPITDQMEDVFTNEINKVYFSHTYGYCPDDPKILLFADQIDGSDYTSYFNTISTQCCRDHIYYSHEWPSTNDFEPTQTWEPGTVNNPFNSYTGTVLIEDDVTIPANKVLTIKDMKFKFAANKKLIIEAGAKLVLDNTVLTSVDECNQTDFWGGIEVWGDKNASQYPYNNSPQGIVELKNGAVIENALEAICAIKKDANGNSDWSKTGGIIKADGAIFRNNKNGVWIGSYHNFNPNNSAQKLSNASSFYNCLFETTDTYNTSMGYPYEFIGLCDVEGIRIYGNTFRNLNTSMSSGNRGNGIISYGVSYTANALCSNPFSIPCPLIQQIPNTFTNLYYAIKSSNINTAKSVQINNNIFTDNTHAIVLQDIDGARITKNVITNQSGYSSGIYLDHCSAYKVEENIINNGFAGIIINNSGESENEIYNNIFNLNIRSCQAQGNNGRTIWKLTGLQFKCNEFNNNNPTCATDIAVTSGSIKPMQGFCSSDTKTPAGNIFTDSTLCFKQLFKNPGADPFTYNYHPGNDGTEPLSFSPGITVIPCSGSIYGSATSCPSKLNNGYASLQLLANINNGKARLAPLYALFDNGSTQNLLDEVFNNNNNVQLTNLLSDAAPYLTDTVMLATLSRTNPLSPAQIEAVFIPNSPLTSIVYSTINSISLPTETLVKIANAQTGVSARTVLEQQISQINDTVYTAENQLMQYYLSDTTGTLLDSLRLYLLDNIDPVNQQRLVKVYMSPQNYTSAKSTLDSIQQKTAADSNFVTFYNLLADVYISGRTLFELDSAEKQSVISVASAKTFVSKNAEALLSMVYGESFPLIIEKLIIDDSLSIRGYLKYDSVCSGLPAAGDTLVVLDADTVRINSISSVITDSTGYFLFYFPEFLTLSDTAMFGFGTSDGTPLKDFELKTLSQWVAASPLNLTLRKTEADFIFDTIRCYAGSVHFTSIVTGGKKPYTYLWVFGNDSVATSLCPAMLYDTTGAYNVTLAVSSADGCTDTVNKTVVVNPLPAAAITPTSAAICIGDSATFTASGGISYLWNTSDTSAVITVAPDATTAYTVTVTSAEGCSNTASTTITVNPLPTAAINSADSAICAGDSATLTASGGITYLWNTADSTAAITVVPDSTTAYMVTVTNATGCAATANYSVTITCADITGRTMYAGKANPGSAPNPPTYDSRIYDINKEIVILKNQSGSEIARDTSDIDGAFSFSGVYNGNYTLAYDKYTTDTMQWCNEVNAIDVAYILYYIAHDTTTDPSRNFSRIYKKAADVNNNGTVDSIDKAKIQAKIGYPNNTAYNFPKGNWVNLDTTISVNGSNVNITIPVISYGDYNASSSKYKDSANTWSQVKALKDENVIFISDESIIINNSGLIEIPLRISSSLNDFSAMGLELFYTKEQFKLVSASMPNTSDSNGVLKINPTLQEIIDNNNDLLVTDDSGIIRVVFATTNIFDVAGNDIMIYLGFLPLNELEQGELDFKLFGTGIIADQYGDEAKAYEFLLMPQIFVQGNHSEDGFEFTGYPNPFRGDATLSYNLPENGMVKLSVYNTLGVCISELVNETQLRGKHTFVFSPKNQPAGMYTFRLDYTGEQNSHCAVLKMIHK